MRKGSYSRPVDVKTYRARHFNPHLFEPNYVGQCGCGATALSTITGTDPRIYKHLNGIDKEGKEKGYGDHFMRKMLTLEGYDVIPLTKRGLNTSKKHIEYPVTEENVLLISQLMARNIATWMVYYGGLYYHSFIVGKPITLDFINKPTMSVYCIYHPSFDVKYHINKDQANYWLRKKKEEAEYRKAQAEKLLVEIKQRYDQDAWDDQLLQAA